MSQPLQISQPSMDHHPDEAADIALEPLGLGFENIWAWVSRISHEVTCHKAPKIGKCTSISESDAEKVFANYQNCHWLEIIATHVLVSKSTTADLSYFEQKLVDEESSVKCERIVMLTP